MNDESQMDRENIRVRIQGPTTARLLVYLPGLHGDGTLISGFRRALGQFVQFVEITYPRTLTWSLADYAEGVEAALAAHGMHSGWLLGESFGSQILWEMLNRAQFKAQGAILAGGFGRHPAPWMASVAGRLSGRASYRGVRMLFSAYAKLAPVRFRNSPETIASMREFIARRTLQDCRAMKHRLELVARNDPRRVVQEVNVPIYALTGFWDPIVPWYSAKRWLKQNCPRLSAHRVLWRADHNVLGTAPFASANQVLNWMAMPPISHRKLDRASEPE